MDSTTREIAKRNKKIKSKEAQLMAFEESLLQLADKVKKTHHHLQLSREMDKSERLASVRHKTHRLTTEMDRTLRAPDQSNDIRTYGKMDLDIWKYEDVRHWFNRYAPTDPNAGAYTLTPAQTGYVIKID